MSQIERRQARLAQIRAKISPLDTDPLRGTSLTPSLEPSPDSRYTLATSQNQPLSVSSFTNFNSSVENPQHHDRYLVVSRSCSVSSGNADCLLPSTWCVFRTSSSSSSSTCYLVSSRIWDFRRTHSPNLKPWASSFRIKNCTVIRFCESTTRRMMCGEMKTSSTSILLNAMLCS